MKTPQQIVDHLTLVSDPAASAKTFKDYCLLMALDSPTDKAKQVFELLVKVKNN